MAYCEIITKIGTDADRVTLKDEPLLYNRVPLTDSIVSEIVEDLIGDAVYEAEEKIVRNSRKFLTRPVEVTTCLRTNVGDMLEDLSSEDFVKKQIIYEDDMTSAEKKDEKKAISEVLSQVKHENPPRGVGDQLMESREIIPITESVSASQHPIVEKKSRLTDLVKNSKQILSKFILNDNLKSKNDEWEEKNEKLVSVTELDCVAPDMEPFKVKKSISPENIPLPEDPDEPDEQIITSIDASMETVDLGSKCNTLGSQTQTVPNLDEHMDVKKKTMTFPVCSGSSKSVRSRISTMRITPKDFQFKRKWSFGSRIINYIRKHSTKTRKETDRDTS